MSYPKFSVVLAAMTGALLLAPNAAQAQNGRRSGYSSQQQGYAYPNRRDYRAGRVNYGDNRYRGGRNYRCDRGTGGTILGAIAGGLLGNAAAGRGDRDVGTVVGAGVGALAGRAIDRDC